MNYKIQTMSLVRKRRYTDIVTSGNGDEVRVTKRQRCDTNCIYDFYISVLPIELLLLIVNLIQDSFGVIRFAKFCRDHLNIDIMSSRDWNAMNYIHHLLGPRKDYKPCCYLYNHSNIDTAPLYGKNVIRDLKAFYEAWLWAFRYDRNLFISATDFIFYDTNSIYWPKFKTHCCGKEASHALRDWHIISLILCVNDSDLCSFLNMCWGDEISGMIGRIGEYDYKLLERHWYKHKKLFQHIPEEAFLLLCDVRNHPDLLAGRNNFKVWGQLLIDFGRDKLLRETIQLLKRKGITYPTHYWKVSERLWRIAIEINKG